MGNADKNHRITAPEQDALMMYVQRLIDEKGPCSTELKEAYQHFFQSNATAHSKRSTDKANWKMKMLTYSTLPEFLSACGLTYKEAIEAMSGRQLDWHREEEAILCSYFEKLTDEQLEYIRDLFWSMIPKDYQELYDLSEQRSYRIQKLISYKNPDKDFRHILKEKYGLSSVWKLSQRGDAYYTNFSLSMLPILSEEGQVGLHWLMGLDDTAGILSSSGKAETIMDYYCFLPQETQKVLYKAITGKEYADHADEE